MHRLFAQERQDGGADVAAAGSMPAAPREAAPTRETIARPEPSRSPETSRSAASSTAMVPLCRSQQMAKLVSVDVPAGKSGARPGRFATWHVVFLFKSWFT
jgi:hypothetical protein